MTETLDDIIRILFILGTKWDARIDGPEVDDYLRTFKSRILAAVALEPKPAPVYEYQVDRLTEHDIPNLPQELNKRAADGFDLVSITHRFIPLSFGHTVDYLCVFRREKR